jgi:hypothetical protein
VRSEGVNLGLLAEYQKRQLTPNITLLLMNW